MSIIGRDQSAVLLLIEPSEFAVACVTRIAARLAMQPEREQAESFRFGGHDLHRRPPEGDGVGGQRVMC